MPDFSNLSNPTYSIATDLGGQLINHSYLKAQINANGTINATRTCHGFSKSGDVLTVHFDADVTNPTQTDAVTAVLAAYTYAAPAATYSSTVSVTPKQSEISSTEYQRQKVWSYPGSLSVGTIKKIVAIGHCDAAVTNFSIEVLDATNGLTVAEATFTDTAEDSDLDLGTVSNVPTGPAKLEISFKKSGGGANDRAHVEDVTFYT